MEVEKVPKQIWIDVITGKITAEFEFLAVKILLGRLRIDYRVDSSPEAVEKSVEELQGLFVKSRHIPSSQRDLQKILNSGGN